MSDSADEALRRARLHLRAATLEGLEAARALLEVAIHGAGLAEASKSSLVGQLQASLDDLIAGVRANTRFAMPTALAEPLSAALDAEIARWEQRSRTDPDARPVLRVFLGLRELLWEIGLGREPDATPPTPPTHPKPPTPSPDRPDPAASAGARSRVQRFDIDD